MNYELTPGNEKYYPPPFRPYWFERQIKQLGQDAGTDLRLAWAPDVESFAWGKQRKVYAVCVVREHIGWFVGDIVHGQFRLILRVPATHFRGFSPEGMHRTRDGKWIVPDWRETEVALPRWVVEERVDPETCTASGETEGEIHKQIRYEWDHERGELVDALGEWPLGGKWATRLVISQHWVECCVKANAEMVMCQGQYRAPNEYDLEEVRKMVFHRDAQPLLRGKNDPATRMEIARVLRGYNDQLEAGKQRQADRYREIFKNELDPVFGMQKLKIDMGQAYQNRDKLKEKESAS